MAIQRYQSRFQPSSLLAQFNDEINRMFVQDSNAFPALSGGAWTPNVDIRETGDAYHIEAEVPGVDPQGIEVTLDKGVLTLKGERSEEQTDESGQARYRERRFGAFVRRFSLPETADEDNIEARAEHGVLRLTINKKARSEPRRITVRTGENAAPAVETQDEAVSA
ncbi:heat shock protein, Hsp20 family [Salinisphaera dokdonensis CL-ES53]|uniref:Heat shock protein, Hsp20 family n=1 Tax=Salinisphaera dokdonensis CL-ES53 TaxID=1304272 RepID=A0ABV2B4R6_9GAMM